MTFTCIQHGMFTAKRRQVVNSATSEVVYIRARWAKASRALKCESGRVRVRRGTDGAQGSTFDMRMMHSDPL